jgi:hypothetical protein
MNATDLAERCSICGNGLLVELAAFRQLRRVTSDCRPWPAGGRLGLGGRTLGIGCGNGAPLRR